MIPLAYNYNEKKDKTDSFSVISLKNSSSGTVSFSDLKTIMKLTMSGKSRPAIAKAIHKSPQCVFIWQRKLFE
jgi:hypothetical protein